MEFRAVLITLVILGVILFLVGTTLRPFFNRIWCYWCAIKAQDEEQRRDAAEIERMRKQALFELENSGPKASKSGFPGAPSSEPIAATSDAGTGIGKPEEGTVEIPRNCTS